MFADAWIRRFYRYKKNPALLPEFNGQYIYKVHDEYYINTEDIPQRIANYEPKEVQVRFDFAVINVSKQKKLLIELDGHEHHHKKRDRIRDSVKRLSASKNGWSVQVFTGTQVIQNPQSCLSHLLEYLLP